MAVAICEGVVVAVVVVVVAVAVAVVVVVVVVVVVIVAVVVVVVMIVVAGVLGVLGFANWSLFTSSHDDTQHLHEERSLQRCFFYQSQEDCVPERFTFRIGNHVEREFVSGALKRNP